MEHDEIYILDEKIPYAQRKALLEKASPLSKEQVVDLIISRIKDQDEHSFIRFKRKFEKLSFQYYNEQEKKEKFLVELSQLEDANDQSRTWRDPKELKTDLLNRNFQFYFEEGKKILYNRQIDDLSFNAANLLVASKKKEYLTNALETLKQSVNEPVVIGSANGNLDQTEIQQNLESKSVENLDKKEKKISEKWYALLHMIYLNMGKVPPFKNIYSKKEVTEYGKVNYPYKGTGQMFYNEIKRIKESKSIYNYTHTCLKKDFGKWKRTILDIAQNNEEVKSWIDTNKM